jgi:hypothetical protein
VRSASITGSSPASWSLIANNQLDPVGIAVTTQGIFWINAGIGGAKPDGSLVWQPNGNTPAVPIGSPYACPLAMTEHLLGQLRSKHGGSQRAVAYGTAGKSDGDADRSGPKRNCMHPSHRKRVEQSLLDSERLLFVIPGRRMPLRSLSPLGTPVNLLPSTVLSGSS